MNRDPAPIKAYALWVVLFLLPSLAIVAVACETAWHFKGVAIDGPFQLYNALRRIEGGFRPGVDFQYFHGLGIPYLHYPFYRLLGGDFAASELARELLSAAAYPLVFLLVFRAFTESWVRVFCLSAASLALTFLLRMPSIVFALNGMLGLRSALPTLLPLAMLLPRARVQRTIATGGALGLALFVSTEQGLAAVLAFIVVGAVTVSRPGNRALAAKDLGASLAIAIAVLLVLLLAIGGFAGAAGGLTYNFRTVPLDQYWYFGAPPNVFLSSWRIVIRALFATPPVGLAIAIGCGLTVWENTRLARNTDALLDGRRFALAFLATYGLISCSALLGIFNLSYAQPCWRTIVIVALVEIPWTSRAQRRAEALPRWRLGVPNRLAATSLVLVALAFLTIPLLVSGVGTAVATVPGQIANPRRFTVDSMWDQTLRIDQTVIDRHRNSDGTPPTVWSTYAGWAEARAGIFHPSFDYIIHALGPELRARYVTRFRADHPALVQTVRPSYSQYEPWIENEDWSFYDELLRWYQPAAITPWSIWWERKAQPVPDAQLVYSATIPAGATGFELPAVPGDAAEGSSPRLLEVEINYEIHNPLRALPLIGANPRYLVDIGGAISRLPVSLDPYVRRMRFPVIVRAGQQPTLSFGTFSLLPGASYRATSIRVFERPIDARDALWLQEVALRFAPRA